MLRSNHRCKGKWGARKKLHGLKLESRFQSVFVVRASLPEQDVPLCGTLTHRLKPGLEQSQPSAQSKSVNSPTLPHFAHSRSCRHFLGTKAARSRRKRAVSAA